ncbi:MAG: Gfo/Idh/MocA family oxidoreductase [Deltaproteobacteria bacterium]|nr:Gfo/Idh/MocA family oxidoreductase [Deltaproteobacteria bacterium]
MTKNRNILLVGLGAFGKNHFAAWRRLGMLDNLYVSDVSEESRKFLEEARFDLSRFSHDWRRFIDQVDVVDVVTGTDAHFPLCQEALELGKDVFCEKPLTRTATEAEALAATVRRSRVVLQVGYYYRYHPMAEAIRKIVQSGRLGRLRYVKAEFLGFKRPRMDVGVMQTDGIHFIDLLNSVVGQNPEGVFAVTRDHLGRNLEDLAIGLFHYPGGLPANIESGYIQPGRWRDKVVPGAMTTKSMEFMGSKATLAADFESDELEVIAVEHQKNNGAWTVAIGGSERPYFPSSMPVEMVSEELADFLRCVEERRTPGANVDVAGVVLARIMEAFYRSAREMRFVEIAY